MGQKDLNGEDIQVTTDEEDKHYNIWETDKLLVKYSDEALEKVRADKDADEKIARKIRIQPDEKLAPGDWDKQSKRLIEAVKKGL
jgi:nitrous oxide reductase